MHPTNGNIPVSSGRFVVTTFSDGESTLRIMNTMESDEGEYQCVLSESSSTTVAMKGVMMCVCVCVWGGGGESIRPIMYIIEDKEGLLHMMT